MITVKVSYTVHAGFAAENTKNIEKFLVDFRKMNPSDFRYHIYTEADGQTFVHLSSYKNEHIQQEVLNTPSFKEFQQKRDESGLNDTHKVEILHHVGSSFDIFN